MGTLREILDAAAHGVLPPPDGRTTVLVQASPPIRYARRRRDEVRAWSARGGILVMGRGIGGRLEVSAEVGTAVRHRGLGRRLVAAARHLVTEPVWAQIAPGNARSVRAFQAAGYVPVGAEILLTAP